MEQIRSHVQTLASLSDTKAFLGREFLTWLWFLAETQKKSREFLYRKTGQPIVFDIWIDDRMVLESLSRVASLSHQSVMKGGDPSQSSEAAAALGAGKVVKELKLGLHIHSLGEFFAVLSGDELNPKTLKLPQVQNEKDSNESSSSVAVSRIRHMELFLAVLDDLFLHFLRDRISDGWNERVLPEIRMWIKNRQDGVQSKTLH